jgi:hypothetical protein
VYLKMKNIDRAKEERDPKAISVSIFVVPRV